MFHLWQEHLSYDIIFNEMFEIYQTEKLLLTRLGGNKLFYNDRWTDNVLETWFPQRKIISISFNLQLFMQGVSNMGLSRVISLGTGFVMCEENWD